MLLQLKVKSQGVTFGAYVGHKLDSFNPCQRATAIKQISDIIFEVEMATSSFGQVHMANVSQHGPGDFRNISVSPSLYSESRGLQRESLDYATPGMAMLRYSHPNPGE